MSNELASKLRAEADASEKASDGAMAGPLHVYRMTGRFELPQHHVRGSGTGLYFADARTDAEANHIAAHSPDVTARHVAVLRWAAEAAELLKGLPEKWSILSDERGFTKGHADALIAKLAEVLK